MHKLHFLFLCSRKLKYSFAIYCILMCNIVNAQYVTISDNSFLNWLINSSVSGCFNTQFQLDTNCSALLNETTVICSYNNIINLDGIQYFKNLHYLDCSDNIIDSIFLLPPSLTSFNCAGNDSLSFISSIPPKLRFLDCSGNRLVVLPTLSDSLITLHCGANLLTALPPLPAHLDTLDCAGNMISTLPAFPASLHVLTCFQNQLTTLSYGISL